MNKIAHLPSDQKAELFSQTAARKGIGPAIIEKDFWVCWALGRLFEAESISSKILFKGGTSLAKVFGLIQRFSEDIDLILNWAEVTQDNPQAPRSRTKQDRFNKEILEKGQIYLREQLLPEISSILGDLCEVGIADDTAEVINVRYPASFSEEYLRPEIRLEIGPLALWCPNAGYSITPYAAEEFPHLFEKVSCHVQVVTAERTFWEKATILHHEANRPLDNPQPPRYSRHYYDVARMAESPLTDSALSRLDLLEGVVQFKDKFYPRGWAKYNEAVPGTFRLVPDQQRITELQEDYRQMQVMIFGEIPSFDRIIEILAKLENQINTQD
ncbi:MAG: nucleotidyl transferase AbiEii/AbiGii toxin family protein [Planctomycetota bacterium]|jgi:hypothetical protein